MRILYYVTAHGYGHALRTCTICNQLSASTELWIRTAVPEDLFREEMKRPFRYFPASFDCGCVQKDGVTTDIAATLQTYRKIAARNAMLLDGEIEWCRSRQVDAVLSDIAPFPLEVAKRAGIPALAVTNFTWHDIYAPYAKRSPAFLLFLEKIREQYAMADLLLQLSPALAMPYFSRRRPIPAVGRKGQNIRGEISRRFALPEGSRLGLIYTGNFGMDRLPWKKLETIKGWNFIGLYPLPENPANYRLISNNDFAYQDIVASADALVGKLGYGTVADCFLNGTPILYLPRDDFAEFPVLEKAVTDWGGGCRLEETEFASLRWEEPLEGLLSRKKPEPLDGSGARICAQEIERIISDECLVLSAQ